MKKQRIKSLATFHSMLKNHWDGHFLYRGEDSTEYTLRPKYGRSQVNNPANDTDNEKAMLREFKRRGTPMIQNSPDNDWEWLALAQHFGMATRLLDWTENPLIAAFFATRANDTTDSVIFILDENRFDDADESQSPFDIEGIQLYRPKHIAPRITSQGGVFTIHGTPSDQLDDDGIERWVIEESCIIEINIMLYTYGINEATVFPDLGGLAQLINLRFGW